MPIANYSTEVPVMRTVGEIQAMLVAAGAQHVLTTYAAKLPVGIEFSVERPGQHNLHFRLPADWRGVQRVLKKQGLGKAASSDEQCQRVVWRIQRDWIRAQMALIESGCADLEQVMLPYLLHPGTQETLYARMQATQFNALSAPK